MQTARKVWDGLNQERKQTLSALGVTARHGGRMDEGLTEHLRLHLAETDAELASVDFETWESN